MSQLTKLFAIFCILGFFSQISARSANAKGNEEFECKADDKVHQALETLIQTKKWPHDPHVDCYWACVGRNKGELNEDGSFNSEVAKTNLVNSNVESSVAERVVEACKDIEGDNLCETAAKIAECYFNQRS